MAEVARRTAQETLRRWIESVNDEGRNLTPWEEKFMVDATDQFDMSGSLSPDQEKVLERIYRERVR